MQQCLDSGCMAAPALPLACLFPHLTESQVISAVLTFVALFAGYMMGSICNLISESGNLLTKILGCYDLYTPLDNFMNGTLDVAGIVYYVTIIALLLFLTGQSIQNAAGASVPKKYRQVYFQRDDHCNGGSDRCCEPVRGRTSGNMDIH